MEKPRNWDIKWRLEDAVGKVYSKHLRTDYSNKILLYINSLVNINEL